MRIVIFGANGPTGREQASQALTAGHEVTAVTRHPGQIPPRDRVAVVGADVTEAKAVDAGPLLPRLPPGLSLWPGRAP